jgi:serine/threonine-protein kinase
MGPGHYDRLPVSSAPSASPAQSRPGHPTEVAGRYRVLHKIAEGGMGVVYKAEHVLSKKRLALKLLYPHLCHGPQAIERFRREVSAAAEIDHPGIVQVFDAGVDADGSFYMAMELLEGESLADRMRRDWPTTHQAIDIVRQILGPLARAHERGFVHRDLKPENIFMARDPSSSIVVAKLLDFGLAREVQRKGPTLTGITFGTPEYMSPEQCMSAKKAGTPSDVWAMGVLMYELVTGYHPFDGETPNAIMVSAIKDPHIPVTQRAPQVPAALVKIIESCLYKEPEKRPQTAGEIADKLERALADVTLTDTRPARNHFDDEAPEDAVSSVSLAGIPIGGADSTAALRDEGPTETQRRISTEPHTSAVRPPMSWAVLVMGVLTIALLSIGAAFAASRLLGGGSETTSTELPTSATIPLETSSSTSVGAPPDEELGVLHGDLVEDVMGTAAVDVMDADGEPADLEDGEAVANVGEDVEVAEPEDGARTGRSRARDRRVAEVSEPAVAASAGGSELSPDQYTAAQACLARGDRACAIGILRDSHRPRDLARVIDLYQAEGRSRDAISAMQRFVRRFPSAPETARYRAELASRGL